jgi:hypothetical protein
MDHTKKQSVKGPIRGPPVTEEFNFLHQVLREHNHYHLYRDAPVFAPQYRRKWGNTGHSIIRRKPNIFELFSLF